MRKRSLLIFCLTLMAAPLVPKAMAESYMCEQLAHEETYASKTGYKILVEGDNGVFFRTRSDFKQDFAGSDKVLSYLRDFNNALKQRGTTLVVLMPPTRGIMLSDNLPENLRAQHDYDPDKAFDSYLTFLDTLRESGLVVADFKDITVPQGNFFYHRDHHWSKDGAWDSAKRTAMLVKTLPEYKDLSKTEFATEEDGTSGKRGTFSKFVEKICKNKVPDEPYIKYNTTVKNAENSADELFGGQEDETLPVVLVGTSNCHENSPPNFPGWLRQELGTDVQNVSIGGAGIDTPILSYLLSDTYKNSQPEILIWEVASHYNFQNSTFEKILRQAIPAIHGECSEDALLEKTLDIPEKGRLPLFSQKDVSGVKDGYLSLTFDQPFNGKFTANVLYKEGKSETLRFHRKKNFSASNRYDHLLDKAPLSGLQSLTLYLSNGEGRPTGKVSARLCPLSD